MSFFDSFWDGKHMDYNESFVMTYAKIIGILSGILFFLSSLLLVVIYLLHRNIRKDGKLQIQDKVEDYEDSLIQIEEFKDKKTTNFTCILLDIINIVMVWLGICLLSLTLPALSGFELIQKWLCGILLFILYSIGIFYQIWRQSDHWGSPKFKTRLRMSTQYFKYLLILEGLVFVSASVILPMLFQKGCLCVFNTGYGIDTFLDLQFSTEWTRGYWLPNQICESQKICHIYATLPQNAMNEVFINVHTGQDVKSLQIGFDNQDVKCQEFPFPSKIEQRGQRRLYTCHLQDLQSNTLYELKLKQNEVSLGNHKYRTPPSRTDERDLVILFGGDWGYQQEGIDIVSQVSLVDPDVILIGGDVGYDNGNLHCYYSWDLFLNTFEQEFADMDRIVPFIFSIGNHDVGFNDYADYNITVNDENGPLYFTYFPQKVTKTGDIPSVDMRIPYNMHLLQKVAIFGLDSGYMHPHDGDQSKWLKEQIEDIKNDNYKYISHYHVPLYPTCFSNSSFMEDWNNLKKGQDVWVPIFDEYQFIAAFENHVHKYKRTFPLKNNKKVENGEKGTIYFGDGSMGVRDGKCKLESQTFRPGGPFEGIFEITKVENSAHFWVMTSKHDDNSILFNAYTPQYTVIEGSDCIVTTFPQHDDL